MKNENHFIKTDNTQLIINTVINQDYNALSKLPTKITPKQAVQIATTQELNPEQKVIALTILGIPLAANFVRTEEENISKRLTTQEIKKHLPKSMLENLEKFQKNINQNFKVSANDVMEHFLNTEGFEFEHSLQFIAYKKLEHKNKIQKYLGLTNIGKDQIKRFNKFTKIEQDIITKTVELYSYTNPSIDLDIPKVSNDKLAKIRNDYFQPKYTQNQLSFPITEITNYQQIKKDKPKGKEM